MIDKIVVFIVIFISILFLARKIKNNIDKKEQGCSCCDGCVNKNKGCSDGHTGIIEKQ